MLTIKHIIIKNTVLGGREVTVQVYIIHVYLSGYRRNSSSSQKLIINSKKAYFSKSSKN